MVRLSGVIEKAVLDLETVTLAQVAQLQAQSVVCRSIERTYVQLLTNCATNCPLLMLFGHL